jgi:hypothetical protein
LCPSPQTHGLGTLLGSTGKCLEANRTGLISGQFRLLAQAKFTCPIKLIWAVQTHLQKYFGSRLTQITSELTPSRSERGAFRDRHGRWMRDAVDAAALLTNSAKADGEVVWS